MIKADSLVRRAPTFLMAVAAVDFAKQLLGLYYIHEEYKDVSIGVMDQIARLKVQTEIIERVLEMVIYPATWLAYSAFATILLAIHDRMKVDNA